MDEGNAAADDRGDSRWNSLVFHIVEFRCVGTGFRRPSIEMTERGGDGTSRETHATLRRFDKAKVISVGGKPESGFSAEIGKSAALFRAKKDFVRTETTCGDDNPVRRDNLGSC